MDRILKGLKNQTSDKGFTLIEILVAVAISGIVMAGIYSAYYSQQRSYEVQEQQVAIQQNLRAAMYFLEREIRMAGCDPLETANAAILLAEADYIQFTEDISDELDDDDDGDGDNRDEPDGKIQKANENITYYLEDNNLRRSTIDEVTEDPLPPQTIAQNVEALNFVYLNADGVVIPPPIAADATRDIASVQIAIVARSERPDPKYSGSQTFVNMQGDTIGTGTYSGHYRRELLTAQVKCRNFGLE